MPINHPFTSGKADGVDATKVQATNWNADHTISDFSQGTTKFLRGDGTWQVPPAATGLSAGAPVMVAASNSTAAEQIWAVGSGGEVCTGVNDELILAAHDGQNMVLSGGTFVLDADWAVASNTRCHGQGQSTILHLNTCRIQIENVDTVTMGDFKVTGDIYSGGAGHSHGAINIENTASHSGYRFHDIRVTGCLGGDHFKTITDGAFTTSDVVFERCYSNDSDGAGFILVNNGTTETTKHVRFYDCHVVNAGIAVTRFLNSGGDCFSTGFDLAESGANGNTFSDIKAIGCTVDGAWESGFHTELTGTKNNIKLIGCSTKSCGYKTGDPSTALFGAYTLCNGEISITDCDDEDSFLPFYVVGGGSLNLSISNCNSLNSGSMGLKVAALVAGDRLRVNGGEINTAVTEGFYLDGILPDSVVVDGLRVIHPTGDTVLGNVILCDNVTVENCYIDAIADNYAIWSNDATNVRIRNNRIPVSLAAISCNNANCINWTIDGNDWTGSTNDPSNGSAVNLIQFNNIDKTGALVP
jgi:hypothetical protein